MPSVSPIDLRGSPTPAWRGEGGATFYHPELDALRFCAFLAVFFHHALPGDVTLYVNAGVPPAAARWLLTAKGAGAYGVDLFFTLSSYLITELLVREHPSRGAIDVPTFYVRRALRIWPLYFTSPLAGGRPATGPDVNPLYPSSDGHSSDGRV